MILTQRQQEEMKIIGAAPGGVIHVSDIKRKLGTADGLKGDLEYLASKRLVHFEYVKNRKYCSLTDRGRKKLETTLTASLTSLEDIRSRLMLIQSGRLTFGRGADGPQEFYHDENGNLEKIFERNPRTRLWDDVTDLTDPSRKKNMKRPTV
jgi:hypothetical protein